MPTDTPSKPGAEAIAAAWQLLDWLIWVEEPSDEEVGATARALDAFAAERTRELEAKCIELGSAAGMLNLRLGKAERERDELRAALAHLHSAVDSEVMGDSDLPEDDSALMRAMQRAAPLWDEGDLAERGK